MKAPTRRAMERVIDYVAAHPGCTWVDLHAALGMPRSTINGYTRRARALGRLHISRRSNAGMRGSHPQTFRVIPAAPGEGQ